MCCFYHLLTIPRNGRNLKIHMLKLVLETFLISILYECAEKNQFNNHLLVEMVLRVDEFFIIFSFLCISIDMYTKKYFYKIQFSFLYTPLIYFEFSFNFVSATDFTFLRNHFSEKFNLDVVSYFTFLRNHFSEKSNLDDVSYFTFLRNQFSEKSNFERCVCGFWREKLFCTLLIFLLV